MAQFAIVKIVTVSPVPPAHAFPKVTCTKCCLRVRSRFALLNRSLMLLAALHVDFDGYYGGRALKIPTPSQDCRVGHVLSNLYYLFQYDSDIPCFG
jgi:hypothetical protein